MAGKRTVQVLVVVNIALLVAQLLWLWVYGRDISLLLACASGDGGKFDLALLLGANPNARTSNGTTALMLAVANRNYLFALDLIRRGADVNSRDEDGDTALGYAVRRGSVSIVKLLLQYGANPNIRSGGFGVTPLMMAAGRGHVEIVKVLLENGADPSVRDAHGRTALNYARPQEGGEHAKIAALIQQKLSEKGNR